ncbi:P-loop NTPase fold protein [Paenibacillus sp. PsM32]|uniref:KAP family P-loop NTPase fold protein n=1 Tax=Paenibacillus sp. PsM32 TaxID=3030536 RepID=UPI00263B8FEB|nr:P-loop NTPase fold protein [Paenibacillus sp. PsM32]MDN4619055.1 P-loop NTPase fold protein [Paenibacillus sp. PsM32]
MWADNASRIDMLSFEPYAELLHEIALNERVNPLTIGLFGNWGSGKSTVLNLIDKKIEAEGNKKLASIFVNAWMFEGYDDAKTALMEVILTTLEENTEVKEKVGELLKGLKERVDWLRLGGQVLKKSTPFLLSAVFGNPLPALMEGINSLIPKNAGQAEEKINQLIDMKDFLKDLPEDNVIQNIRKFRTEFEQMLEKSELENLIIIIDDLDRCSPERIIETIEAIKLFLSVKRTTFIVAIDEDIMSYAVQRKYPKIDDAALDISKDYIEKIIQIPIKIPELSEIEVKNYLLLLICEMFLNEPYLDKLLTGLKGRNVFVKGEIISSEEIRSILESEGITLENGFKNGYLKEHFEDQLDVFGRVADVVSATLKGNPRQAKRFINTFYIRKKLSEIQGLELDLSILAKLMVLEYTNLDLFREIYAWHIANEGFATELAALEKYSLGEDGQTIEELKQSYSNLWFKPIVQHWFKVEPIKLSEIDLRQYFYLAKESIKEKSISVLDLTLEERSWINNICAEGLHETLRIKKIEEFSQATLDHSKIVKGIVAKYQSNKEFILKILIRIYVLLPAYRDQLIKEFKKLRKDDMTPTNILLFNLIRNINEQDYQELKSYFIEEGIVELELWNQVADRRR